MALTGISHRFAMRNGKIAFTSGKDKTRDNIHFFMMFYATVRVYLPDYTPDTIWMIQKPVSYVSQYQALFTNRLRSALSRYIPNVSIETINVEYFRGTSPTLYAITISFRHLDAVESSSEIQTATFV